MKKIIIAISMMLAVNIFLAVPAPGYPFRYRQILKLPAKYLLIYNSSVSPFSSSALK